MYQITCFFIILIFSLILSIQDLKHKSVKIYIQILSILSALACQVIFLRTDCWIYILSSLIMGGFYFLVRKITKNKLGLADIWFGLFQGLFLTPFYIPICLAIEAITALIIINKRFGKREFPFIPFMAAGLIITYVIASVAKQSM